MQFCILNFHTLSAVGSIQSGECCRSMGTGHDKEEKLSFKAFIGIQYNHHWAPDEGKGTRQMVTAHILCWARIENKRK